MVANKRKGNQHILSSYNFSDILLEARIPCACRVVETRHKLYVFPCLYVERHNIVFNSQVICSVIIAVYRKNNNNRGTEKLSNFWFKYTQRIESKQIHSTQSQSFHCVIHISSIIPILTLMALLGSVSSQLVLVYFIILFGCTRS